MIPMRTVSDALREQLEHLPTNPGVYLMRDAGGTLLYVGKAINLRQRVKSYFRDDKGHAPKVRALVKLIASFETISTDTEVEALVLENVLIKEHQPRFNILLKDDKTYPWLKLTQEPYPRLIVTRRRLADGARYFGPYPDVGAMHATLRLIKQLFPLRQRPKPQFKDRPCLNYAIGRCSGPCQQLIRREEYAAMVGRVVLFLEGRYGTLVRELRSQMQAASEALEFERAARLRDGLASLERLQESQKVVGDPRLDEDAIAIAHDELLVAVQLFEVREGKVLGRRAYVLERQGEAPETVLGAFLAQYYARVARVPAEILLPLEVPDQGLLEAWLSQRRGKRVRLAVPRRGDKLKLVEMVAYNAQQALETERLMRWAALERGPEVALAELARALELPASPHRIEGYDIAHVQGTDTVASMVVIQAGAPARSDYRRFKIKRVVGADDFASMREVLDRRLGHAEWPMPDLILIDGGKGQLSAALEAMAAHGMRIPVFGLAKQFEEVYLPGRSEPVRLDRRSPALQLLQRLRDEAHRFANSFHGQQRAKRMTHSILEEVPGLGAQRRIHLLKEFGSVEVLRQQDPSALMARGKLPRAVAEALVARLHPGAVAP